MRPWAGEEDGMSTTRVRVTRPGQTRTSRSFARRHAAFAGGELVALLAALALTVIVKRHPGPLPGDVEMALALQHFLLPHHWLVSPVDKVSAINWPVPSAIVVAGVVGLLLAFRRWLAASMALLTSALADASSYITNEIVRRPRPSDHGLHILHVIKTYFSFPSGHVIHAVTFFGFVLFLTWQTRRPAPLLWPVRAVLIALIVLMGPSRVLEGEHWPSDVLGGLLYGAFWLILGLHLYSWAGHRRLADRAKRDRHKAA